MVTEEVCDWQRQDFGVEPARKVMLDKAKEGVWRSTGCSLRLAGLVIILLCCGSRLSGQTAPAAPTLDDYFSRARDAEKRGDYADAERIYQQAAKNFPNQPEILKRLGIVYQTELKFPASIDAFERVLQGAPQYPEVNFYLGLSDFGLNQFDKAVDAFNKELDANPKYRRARYHEALAFQSLNRNADAM